MQHNCRLSVRAEAMQPNAMACCSFPEGNPHVKDSYNSLTFKSSAQKITWFSEELLHGLTSYTQHCLTRSSAGAVKGILVFAAAPVVWVQLLVAQQTQLGCNIAASLPGAAVSDLLAAHTVTSFHPPTKRK